MVSIMRSDHTIAGRAVELDNMMQLEAVGQALGRWHSCVADYTLAHRPAFNVK